MCQYDCDLQGHNSLLQPWWRFSSIKVNQSLLSMSHFDLGLATATLPGVIAQCIFLQINMSRNICHPAAWRLQSTILSAQDKRRKWGTRELKESLQTCVCWSLHLAYRSSRVRGGERDRRKKKKQRGSVTEKEKQKTCRDKCRERGQSLNTNRTRINNKNNLTP